MASSNKYQFIYFIVFFFIFKSWAFQVRSRSLYETTMYERHENWMSRYGRMYKDNDEKDKRFVIFKANVEYIESFNKAMNKNYKLGVNEFADLTTEEFKGSRIRFKRDHAYASPATSLSMKT